MLGSLGCMGKLSFPVLNSLGFRSTVFYLFPRLAYCTLDEKGKIVIVALSLCSSLACKKKEMAEVWKL